MKERYYFFFFPGVKHKGCQRTGEAEQKLGAGCWLPKSGGARAGGGGSGEAAAQVAAGWCCGPSSERTEREPREACCSRHPFFPAKPGCNFMTSIGMAPLVGRGSPIQAFVENDKV